MEPQAEVTFIWDMSPERNIRDGHFWLLPRDHPQHPLYGMSMREVRRWRRGRRSRAWEQEHGATG